MRFNQSLNEQTRQRGLVIKEAYYGLAEHIYHLEAGLGYYKVPSTVTEYYQCQVLPVKKQLQILVEDSSLNLTKYDIIYKMKKKK